MFAQNVSVDKPVEELWEGSVTAAAGDSVKVIQMLLKNQIKNLIWPLSDDDTDINIGSLKDRLGVFLVDFECIFLSAVRIDEQKQLSRSIEP